MGYTENETQCFPQTKYFRRYEQFVELEYARCCNPNATADKMSASSFSGAGQRRCRRGERPGPAAAEQSVEDLRAGSWPRWQSSSEKGHLRLLLPLWPEAWWVQYGLVLRGRAGGWPGTLLLGVPSCTHGLLKDVLQSAEEAGLPRLQFPWPQAGDDAGLSLSSDKGWMCSGVSRRD